MRFAIGAGIRRVTSLPRAALTARVHDEMGKPGRTDQRVVGRESTSTTIAEIFHHTWYRFGSGFRHQDPGPNRLAIEAGKGDIVHILSGEASIVGYVRSGQVVGTGVIQGVIPERIEIVWFMPIGLAGMVLFGSISVLCMIAWLGARRR